MTETLSLIVPFPPGGSTDFTSRVLADALTERWNRPVEIESCTAEFGIEAMTRLIDAGPDKVLLVGTVNTNSIAPVLRREDFPFDYAELIAPVSRLADFPSIVAAPATTTGDLHQALGRLRESTGQLRYSTDFVGTNVDIDMLLLAREMDLEVGCRPTSGALEILADLEAGRTDLAILNVAPMAMNRGRYRPLAITSRQRRDPFPDVPTLAESGFPGIGISNWQGLFAPRRMAGERRDRLFAAVVDILNDTAVSDQFTAVGAQAAPSASPAAFSREITAEMSRWQEHKPDVLSIQELR